MGNYEEFKKSVYQLTRIDLDSYKERQMKRRIDALITKHSLTSYKEFITEIKRNTSLMDEFINYLTINVSEFYRNPEQWGVLENEVLPEVMKERGKRLKIWSAACSTGDEPYSLVMLLSKYMPLNNINIIATDIDKQVLEKAQLGIYNEKYLKALPKEMINRYFTRINDKTLQISPEIKKRVEFKKHDLLKDPYPSGCNLIVCRNVVIYFTEEAKDVIYQKFHKALQPGGVLFIGSTEQIMNYRELGFDRHTSFFFEKK